MSAVSTPNLTTSARKKRVVLLGATGSIGENTLRVIAAHSDQLELVGIAAHSSADKLAAIARAHRVPHVALFDEAALARARSAQLFPPGTTLHGGLSGLVALAQLPEADIVLIAVVGTTGLEPALAAIRARKPLALASKEILVLAGKFVTALARENNVPLLPVDSEHNAVFQCLEGHPTRGVRRVTLTASGGAFRDWPLEKLTHVTPADALKHPNWAMGPKITVDSATLANKGLELIEAQWLVGLRAEQCHAVIHPQSIVHSIVEFTDGSMLAQLCPPSMTFPIQHCLLHPERAPRGTDAPLDFEKLHTLDFRPIDPARAPMLRLAQQTMHAGGVAPAIYNAANEIAVAAFLAGKIPYLAIPQIVDKTLQTLTNFEPTELAAVLETDTRARQIATQLLPA